MQSATVTILQKLISAGIGGMLLAPISVIICLPYLFVASRVDKDEYWSSFWWRGKRIAAVGLTIGCLIGARFAPWTAMTSNQSLEPTAGRCEVHI